MKIIPNTNQYILIYRTQYQNMQNQGMNLQSPIPTKSTIRLRIKTNKGINMIIAIEIDKTMRELAHRVLNCYHQLAEQCTIVAPKRRDLSVSAIKIESFFVSKSEIIGNMLKDNDEVECVLSKAKPRFPQCPKSYPQKQFQKMKVQKQVEHIKKEYEQKLRQQNKQLAHVIKVANQKQKSKRQIKKDKIKQKMQMLQGLKKNVNQSERNKIIFFQKNQDQINKLEESFQIQRFSFNMQKQSNDPVSKDDKENKEVQVHQFSFSLPNVDHQMKAENTLNNINPQAVNVSFDSTVSNGKQLQKQKLQKQKLQKQKQKEKKSQQPEREEVVNKIKQEIKRKKNTNMSILQILSKATEQKDKKLKKKQKKIDKAEEIIAENKSADKNSSNSKNSLSIVKNDKESQLSNSKIASPKVTFHSSPMLSPQGINLNSPKRKISNPMIQKIQLQVTLETKQIKNQVQKEKQKEKQKAGKEMKKQPITTNKIIVEEDSEVESAQMTKKPKQINAASNPLLKQLNNKISKYKLEFFNGDSDSDQ